MKKLIVNGLILGCLVIVVFVAKDIILGGVSTKTLTHDPLSGVISEALQGASGSSYLPIEGSNYSISNIKYFNNSQWVVVSITPISTYSDPATIVMDKVNGAYKVAFGPANSFQGSNLSGLPTSVVGYLKSGVGN